MPRRAILGALLAEWLATGQGLGSIMLTAATRSKYDQLWAAVAITTILAVVAYITSDMIERAASHRFTD